MYSSILVFHPAAIGDAVLATPVAGVLKRHNPDCQITYLTHESLIPLLETCPNIDKLIAYSSRTNFLKQIQFFRDLECEFIVDLAGSFKAKMLTAFSGKPSVHYAKQPAFAHPKMHAVYNFLETIVPVIGSSDQILTPEARKSFFPTLHPPEQALAEVAQYVANEAPIGIVPSVGKFRPHRAWPVNSWIALCKILANDNQLLLIGGKDDEQVCSEVETNVRKNCRSVAGKLSLVQTAAALKKCKFVISGDTGPAHIAVGVGTPVVGIYGPTFPQRSCPFGMEKYLVDVSRDCRCHVQKYCLLNDGKSPGKCMTSIKPPAVLDQIAALNEAFKSKA